MAVLCGASSLREVIAFPKSYYGRDLLTGSPTQVDPSVLREYGLRLLESEKKNI